MRRTAALLATSAGCLLAALLIRRVVGNGTGTAFTLLGLAVLVAAIASSYLSDVREGYRSAGED
jgi:hypothetical protein